MSEPMITVPTAPTDMWEHLTRNEQAWIEFIRTISAGRDPKPTPRRVRALADLLDDRA